MKQSPKKKNYLPQHIFIVYFKLKSKQSAMNKIINKTKTVPRKTQT